MDAIFNEVFQILMWCAAITGLTYNEVNILVYYFFLPMINMTMLDKILKTHFCKIAYLLLFLAIVFFTDFHTFSDWLFAQSVAFLESLDVLGWNYIVSSVVVCVLLPLVIFIVLFYYSYWPAAKNVLTRSFRNRTENLR